MRIGVSREWTYHMQESLMQQSVKRVTRGVALSNRDSWREEEAGARENRIRRERESSIDVYV